MNARLIAIEEKIAHLEHHLGQLDGVVRDLNTRIDGFHRQLEAMRQIVETKTTGAGREHLAKDAADPVDDDGRPSDQTLKDDKPPHW